MHVNDFLDAASVVGVAPLLIGAFAKGMIILMVGALCALVARAASAATRHLIWTLSLTGALVAPAVTAIVPRWAIAVPRWLSNETPRLDAVTVSPALSGASSNVVLSLAPRARSTVSVGGTAAVPRRRAVTRTTSSPATAAVLTPERDANLVESRSGATSARGDGKSANASAVVQAVPATPSLIMWLVVMWALGAIVSIIPCVVGIVRLSQVARRARDMRGGRWALLVPSAMRELDVRRRVRFVESDEPVMPMTWGIFHPIVLLPADDFDSTIEQRLDVLRHELAHVRRYDCLTQLTAQLACAVHWFNPLAWMAAAQLRAERERACDDEVLRAGSKASEYADYLLRVARSTRVIGAAALGGLAMARPSQMAGRLMAVLDDRRPRGRVSRLTTAQAVVAASVVVGSIASVTPRTATARAATPAVTAQPRPARNGTTVSGIGGTAAPGALPPAPASDAIETVVPRVSVVSIDATTASTAAPALATVAAAPAETALLAAARPAPCDRAKAAGGEHSRSTSITTDDGSKRWKVRWSEGDCSFEVDARGEFKFNRDLTDIESMSSGASFTIEQHDGDDTKRLVIRPTSPGTLERTYFVNGAKADYDAAAGAWFADAIITLERQTAFAVDQRVPAILERAGVDGVLQEITLLSGDYARRRYYTKLLSMRQLDRAQVRRVVEQAGSQMSSDYELAELLVAVAKLDAFGDDSHAAFVSATKKIDSDYERRRALTALLQRDRLAPATVQALLEAASTIGSDYELAELLIGVSKRYAMNDDTRPVYIKAVGSIESDYEHRRVLTAIHAGGNLTPSVTRALLEDARRISSDYELAEFLIQVAKSGGLDASTNDAYFAAADKIGSDYEHHRALSPLISRGNLTPGLAKAVLASAAKIDSDYECASLLVEFAKAITIDDNLRPAFERAAGTIQSEYDYGRAMAAVRRSATPR